MVQAVQNHRLKDGSVSAQLKRGRNVGVRPKLRKLVEFGRCRGKASSKIDPLSTVLSDPSAQIRVGGD